MNEINDSKLTTRMDVILQAENIHKSYGKDKILDGISFEVKRGECIIIVGPSGTGKSTLLRCINYLVPPDKGHIWFNGQEVIRKNVNQVRLKMSMVFQDFALFDHLTALSNVMIGLTKGKKIDTDTAREIAIAKLTDVGLANRMKAYPGELSGGQKQRVGIARALAMEPELILFDEPTSALDPELIGEVLEIMKSLAKKNMTMMVVTHEMGFARSAGNRMFFMEGGKIIEEGSIQQLFSNPREKRTGEFLFKLEELYGKG
jgi:polar amino acid transport system ATP-binding protein